MRKILKKIYKSRIFGLISILVFIAVCMGIGAFAAYVKYVSNPTEQAVTYFRAFMQQDYDTMYNLLDKKEGYYISKDRYKEIMQKNRESIVIDSYKISDPKKEDGKYIVTIECIDDEADSSQDINIYLNKKIKLPDLKPDYKVDVEKMIVKNLTIKAPAGDKLKIAGTEITDRDANVKTENNIKTYSFKAILNGNYRITCENDYCAKNTTANVIKKDMEVDLTKGGYTANDKYTSKIKADVTDFMNKYYSAARKRSKNNKQLMALVSDSKLQKSVSEAVEKTMSGLYWSDKKNIDKYNVNDFKIKDLKNTIVYNSKNKDFQVTSTYSYDYTCTTDIATYTSYIYKYSGTCKATLNITYGVDNGNLKIKKIKLSEKHKRK